MARSILITGSSHGIGAGCAIAFARDEQANIGICGNKNPEGAQEIARQCEAYGAKTKIYLGDVGSHDFCKEIMEEFIKTERLMFLSITPAAHFRFRAVLRASSRTCRWSTGTVR